LLLILFLAVITPASANLQVLASNTLRWSNDSLASTTSTTYVKLLEITPTENITGTIRVKWEMNTTSSSSLYGIGTEVRKNGVAVSLEHSTTSNYFVQVSEDISITLNTTDRIELWGYTNGGDLSFVRNFRVYYDPHYINATCTGNCTVQLDAAYNGQDILDMWVNITPKSTRADPYDIPTNGLVGWWRHDEATGNTLIDYSSTANNGTLYGTYEHVEGMYNNAVHYSGTTGTYAEIPSNTAYDFGSGNWTIIMLVKINNISKTGSLLGKDSETGRQFGIEMPSPGVIRVVTFSSNVNYLYGDTDAVFPEGSYHWIEVGYDNSKTGDNRLYIRIDGTQYSLTYTNTSFSGTMQSTTTPLRFGARSYTGYEGYMNITIDNVLIYNRTLNESDRLKIYYDRAEQIRATVNNNTWSNYWNTSSDNPVNITYNASDVFGSVYFTVPSSVIQNNVTIRNYLPTYNVTIYIHNTTPKIKFVPPTKLNQQEPWNTRSTTIKVTTTEIYDNVTLYWDTRWWGIKQYPMNQVSTTDWEITLTDLYDGKYYYYVVGTNTTNGNNYTTPTYYVEIDLGLHLSQQMENLVYLLGDAGIGGERRYVSSKTKGLGGFNTIEPEFRTLASGGTNRVHLIRCQNATTNIYMDTISDTCPAGFSLGEDLGYIYSVNNVNLYPVERYKNTTYGTYVTIVNRTPPAGYVYDTTLGYTERVIGRDSDRIYINNSKIKVGIDIVYGGAITYLSELNNNTNLVNNYDAGRQIQSSFYHWPESWTSSGYNETNFYETWSWNPVLSGSKYGRPSRVINYTYTNHSATFITNLSFWNPDGLNSIESDLQLIITYTFDGENPVLIANYTYIHFGEDNHSAAYQENAAVYINPIFSIFKFHNGSELIDITSEIPNNDCLVKYDGVFAAIVNDTNYGVGVWNWGRPRIGFCKATTYSDDEFASPVQYITPQPFLAVGGKGNTGTLINRIYLGSLSSMTSYFTSLEYGIAYDPITPVNQTVYSDNFTIQVNSTEIAEIKNATLHWTNSTGPYNISMTVNEIGTSASITMSNLQNYSYTYYVSSYATTGAYAQTGVVYTNVIPPSSSFNQSVFNTGWQPVFINTTQSFTSMRNIMNASNVVWIARWNSSTQRWETYKAGWSYRATQTIPEGEAVYIKFANNDTVTRDNGHGNYNWTVKTGWNLLGLDYNGTRTLEQINTSINSNGVCDVDKIVYIEPQTQQEYTYTCGLTGNASIAVRQGEGFWVNSTKAFDRQRSW